jgi:hypothetical protein
MGVRLNQLAHPESGSKKTAKQQAFKILRCMCKTLTQVIDRGQ